jgi:hypothetical protein
MVLARSSGSRRRMDPAIQAITGRGAEPFRPSWAGGLDGSRTPSMCPVELSRAQLLSGRGWLAPAALAGALATGALIPTRVADPATAVLLSVAMCAWLGLCWRTLNGAGHITWPSLVVILAVPLFVALEVATGSLLTLLIVVLPMAALSEYGCRRAGRSGPFAGLLRSDQSLARDILLAVPAAMAASAALLWFLSGSHTIYPVPRVGRTGVAALIVGFGLANAAAEELVWRVALPLVLSAAELGRALVILAGSASFGLAHFYGVPWGITGCGMAFAFGVMLEGARTISGGPRAGLIIHTGVDIAVALLVLRHWV